MSDNLVDGKADLLGWKRSSIPESAPSKGDYYVFRPHFPRMKIEGLLRHYDL